MPAIRNMVLAMVAGLVIGVMSAPPARTSDPADMCRADSDPVACVIAFSRPAMEGL